MIISASRRTDIPAFYADWFMTRVREGFFYRVNPFNSKQVTAFSLKPEHVDAICFWTKNPQPLLKYLQELDQRGLKYLFQFTLNPYDSIFEPQVPPLRERIDTMCELAQLIGPERIIWRYDPVILSSVTPVSWHLEQVESLAGQLKNATRRLMFSFYDFYGRGEGRLSKILKGSGIVLEDIAAPEHADALQQLVQGFKASAARNKLEIFSCCEDLNPSDADTAHGACIDGPLIQRLFGVNAPFAKDRNQRKACRCVESVDMGAYNSCSYRCSYCYANFNEGTIEANIRKHRSDSPSLLNEYSDTFDIRTTLHQQGRILPKCQQPLFL